MDGNFGQGQDVGWVGVGGLRLRGFGRLDEHRMFHSEVKLGIIFGIQLSQSGTNCLFFKSYQFSLHPHCGARLKSQKDGPHIVE